MTSQQKASAKYYQANKEKCLERARQWRLANPELSKAAIRNWKIKYPERHAASQARQKEQQPEKYLMKTYGLTKAAWDNIFESQGRICYLCGTDRPGLKGQWHTDHSHATGRVRSILCHPCNVGLGLFKDNAGVLRKAADYVEYHA